MIFDLFSDKLFGAIALIITTATTTISSLAFAAIGTDIWTQFGTWLTSLWATVGGSV